MSTTRKKGLIAREMYDRLVDLTANLNARGDMTEDRAILISRLYGLAERMNNLETNMLIAPQEAV